MLVTARVSTPSFRLYFLGSFRVERDGETIHLPTRKTESLLAYLVLHPEEHLREKIATLFWGESSDEHARRSLQMALTAVRQQLGTELLLTDRSTVQLDPQYALWVDALEFEILAREFLATDQSALHINYELYRGELLDGFDDEWIRNERARLRTLYLDVLLRLTQRFREQGEYSRAIETAHQVLATDVANERAHQQLMWCYLFLDEREAAFKQYAECRRALREELDVDPSSETEALYQRIKQTKVRHPTLETANTNLPTPITTFIGRTRELASVKQMLVTARLLTLTGVGGCGKTRLAIQVATDLVDQFADGVWWVELAAVSDASLVPHVVRKVLGLGERPGVTVLDLLLNHLHSKHVLLVLDNCEHLVAASARLAEHILSHCLQVQILATSREALNLSGEVAWLMPSLSLPAENATPSPENLMQWEGIHLFVERAKGMRADFAITAANMDALTQICYRLDGIPLAIELAAARLKTLSLEQIAARLDDRFHLLTMGSRNALPRHQTLRATMDWSYDLLTEAERVLFHRLSVFAGGWTLEAAEAICAGNGIEGHQVLNLMSHLVDKSLVIVEPRTAKPRYHFLETIRQYASEKLSQSGEYASARNRHLNHFLGLAEQVNQKMGGAEQLAGYDRLEEERDNWRAALTWSIENRSDEEGLRLAGALWWFWQVRGYWREGGKWLRRILETTRDGLAPESARVKALIAAAGLAWRQNQMDWAAELCWEALPLCQKLGDRKSEAFCNGTLGMVAWYQGNLSEAKARHGEALRIRRQIQDVGNIAYSLGNLALVSWSEGNFHEAAKLADESVTVSRNEASRWQVAEALVKRATVARAQGDFELARALYTESLKIRRAMADKPNIPFALEGFAALAARADPQRAARLWGAAENLRQTTNSLLMPAYQKDYAPLIAGVRVELGAAAFDAAWAEGQAMTLEQAVEEALAI